MTNSTRIIPEKQSPESSSQSSHIDRSVIHKAAVVESVNAEMLSDSSGENTLPPCVLKPEFPPILSEKERTALFQKRKEEFPARTAELDELAKVGGDLAAAARKYKFDHQLLCNDLELIWKMLEGTLDDPSDGIHYSVDSHERVLRNSAFALNGLANVINILQPVVNLPIQTNVLRHIASRLDFILDSEGKLHSGLATDQHWAEADLAESGLWPLKEQVENLNAFIELGRKPLRSQPAKKDLVDFVEIRRRLKVHGRIPSLKTLKNLPHKKGLEWGPPAAVGSGRKHLFDWCVVCPILESHFEISFCDYSQCKAKCPDSVPPVT